MLAHLPLRGVVRSRVLALFANSYRGGGAPLEIDAGEPAAKPWPERLAAWYVQRKQRENG
jgi:hypothetical protein